MQSLGSKVGVRGRPSLCPHLGRPPAGIHVSLVSLSVSNKESSVACCVAGWASVPLLGPQAACSPSLALLSLLVFHPPSFFLRLAPLSLTTVFIFGPNSFLSVGERKDYKDVYFRIMKPTPPSFYRLPFLHTRFAPQIFANDFTPSVIQKRFFPAGKVWICSEGWKESVLIRFCLFYMPYSALHLIGIYSFSPQRIPWSEHGHHPALYIRKLRIQKKNNVSDIIKATSSRCLQTCLIPPHVPAWPHVLYFHPPLIKGKEEKRTNTVWTGICHPVTAVLNQHFCLSLPKSLAQSPPFSAPSYLLIHTGWLLIKDHPLISKCL